jgi:hypothetical protein
VATQKPNVQKSEPPPGNPNQSAPRIIDNEPADTLAEALANGKRQIEAANKQ